jgi:hypothetical protein
MNDMNHTVKAEHFPWLDGRKDPNAKPIYKIIARSMSLGGDSIVMLHRAGNDCVVNYYIRDLVKQEKIMEQMDLKEAELLRWVVKSEIIDPLNQ